jgi:ABC-type Fe3+/spermidine/putrescine transport system ATPase subunit
VEISIRGVVKRFGAVTAVDRADLSVRDGELFTLLGPSGCGKTSLLRLLAGFYQPLRLAVLGEEADSAPDGVAGRADAERPAVEFNFVVADRRHTAKAWN